VRFVVVVVVALLSACATVKPEVAQGAPPHRREVRAIDPSTVAVDAVKFAGDEQYAWFDGNSGHSLTFDEVLAKMKSSRVVMVGEEHDQPTHHELERRVVASLAQATPNISIGLEMLTWNAQPGVDRFNRGEIDADAMAMAIDWKTMWGFPFEMYKPIFVDGHAAGARFVALNAPRALVHDVRVHGLDGLSADERKALPELDLGDVVHRAWFSSIMTGDAHPGKTDVDVDSFYTAQVVWDESMARSTADALKGGAPQVVVIAGMGHVARGRGIPERVERRVPEVHVLSIVPVVGATAENAAEKLKKAVVDGEADILVVPRFADEVSL
jgi:uncharacterized iron-regulated protein